MFAMVEDKQLPVPGFCVRTRPRGVAVHISASAPHLRALRELAGKELSTAGVDADTIDGVRLVVSELVGNSVRACGDHVPVVIEVYLGIEVVYVNVHDPEPRLPRHGGRPALDDAEAESGRGLALVDLLCSGWRVARSPIGKQIRCRLVRPSG